MTIQSQNTVAAEIISGEERLPSQLRALYRSYGYQIFKMANFEPYDLYRENKNFIASGQVLTFSDANGRLMALRPDVTLSIVQEAPANGSRKLFYSEHVFRRPKGADRFAEIKQLGLEYLGADTGYAQSEVVALALLSLAAIRPGEEQYFLSLSQMDFVGALLAEIQPDDDCRAALLAAIRQKSKSDIRLLLGNGQANPRHLQVLEALLDMSAQPQLALSQMGEISLNEQMLDARDELAALVESMAAWGLEQRLRIDLSLLNDFDYYNGLVFQGYVRGLPRAVLAGGRYDQLMRRFGKDIPALGFALYLDQVAPALAANAAYDVDTLLLYTDEAPARVAQAVRRLTEQGISVRAEKQIPRNLRARRTCSLEEVEGQC